MKIYLNSYNVCRSALALGTLLTLLLNSHYDLFGNNPPKNSFGYYNLSLFFLFNPVASKLTAIIGLLLVISGFYPRITGIIHWYISYSLLVYCDVIDGGDQISSNLTFLLIPLTLLDKNKNHWKSQGIVYSENYYSRIIQKIFFNLILAQVCIIYLHAFVGKLFIDEWENGTAAYYWLTNNYFGINPIFTQITRTVLANEYITTIITWGTLFLEFVLAAFIFVARDDKRRYILFFIAVFFHFSIFVFHGLASFFFATFGALSIYLLPENKFSTLNL